MESRKLSGSSEEYKENTAAIGELFLGRFDKFCKIAARNTGSEKGDLVRCVCVF
jgi:hypothetical protein